MRALALTSLSRRYQGYQQRRRISQDLHLAGSKRHIREAKEGRGVRRGIDAPMQFLLFITTPKVAVVDETKKV